MVECSVDSAEAGRGWIGGFASGMVGTGRARQVKS
jgi:hypothetical protein